MKTVIKSNIDLKNLNILKLIDLVYSSDNTVELSLSQTTELLKRSIDMKHSKSDNTVGVPFSLYSVNTVEAPTQMFNQGEPRTNSGEPINNYNYGG